MISVEELHKILPAHQAVAIRVAAVAAYQGRPKAAEYARRLAGYANLGEPNWQLTRDGDPED